MQTQTDVLGDSQGVPVRGASVRVATYPADVTASLFDPFTEVGITNPIFSADGSFAFKAANGTYQITISGNGIAPVKLAPFVLYDPADDPPVSATVFATSDGATKIGVGANTVAADLNALQLADYTALRAYAGARKSVYVTGYLASAAPSGIAGMFVRDDSDTTTADDGAMCIVTAGGKRYKRRFDGGACVDFFGADTSGATDSSAAMAAAFTWLAAGNRKLYGSPGAQYKVSQSLSTRGHFVTFDGRNCTIINAINGSGGGAADPLFAITAAAGGNMIELCNTQIQYDVAANKGHTVSIIGDSQNPQAVTIRNIKPYYQIGQGKDYAGAAMDACTVYAYGVYTVFCDEIYAQQGSAGLYFDTVEKVRVEGNVIDSTVNYGMKFDNCANVVVGGRNIVSGCGQSTQAGVYYNNCESFVFRDNRVKAGAGAEILAGPTASRSVTIAGNHLEIYTSGKNAIYAKSNTDSLTIENNYIKFIGGYGPFSAGICVDDTGIGTQSHGSTVIRRNKIVVGGSETLTNGISLTTSSDQISSVVIESNTIGDLHCVAPVITNAISLAGTGASNCVISNTVGAPNVTVTNGIVIGSQQTSTLLENNQNIGTVTNSIVDSGVRTRQYASGAFNMTLTGCTTSPSVACAYERQGKVVSLKIFSTTATSNAVTCSMTGLPSSLQPATTQLQLVPVMDNGTAAPGWVQLTQSSTVSIYKNNPASSGGDFTNTGTKGITATTVTYSL